MEPIFTPEQTAENNAAFKRLDELLEAAGKHPTQTVRGSLWVDHADGTSTHWSIRRPMTEAEAQAQAEAVDRAVEEGARETRRRLVRWSIALVLGALVLAASFF
jgi:hypothetical protein